MSNAKIGDSRVQVKGAGYWLAACVLAVGCNRSGLDLAEVDGVVKYNGAPVANASVLFKPTTGPFAMGATDAEGKFTLKTANRDGALVGEHQVAISKSQTTAKQVGREMFPRYTTVYAIPEKYASPVTSELTAVVSDDADDNHFTFDLQGNAGS
jgi:hypothetical protein